MTMRAIGALAAVVLSAAAGGAQQTANPAKPTCAPVAMRTQEVGCWIHTDAVVGVLPATPVYWHLETFPSRAAAETAKPAGATVIEALGKVWLMIVSDRDARAAGGGTHVADIGPLTIKAGREYSATYMEAVFTPGMEAPTHTHSGPEAWYTLAGETCLEPPDGVMVGRAGGPPVIVPEGPPMHLTATGTVTRRALVLILHDAAQRATTVTNAWTPKGLCRSQTTK
jgi:quercetin dioxygenase-like cupin family protein